MLSYVVVFRHSGTGECRTERVKASGKQDAIEAAVASLAAALPSLVAQEPWQLHSVNRSEP